MVPIMKMQLEKGGFNYYKNENKYTKNKLDIEIHFWEMKEFDKNMNFVKEHSSHDVKKRHGLFVAIAVVKYRWWFFFRFEG